MLLSSEALQAEIQLDERHYANRALEIAFTFEKLFDDSYLTYNRDKETKDIYANLITTNVAKRFAELCRKTKAIVLMSGTLHSEDVLKNVFGIKDFSVVEAETITPGKIEVIKTGSELNCDYKTLNSDESKRREYLSALSACMEKAVKPVLVHVNAFEDLPAEEEIMEYSIANIVSRQKLREMQENDKKGEDVSRFKAKVIDSLFSTKCSRGVDFPGDSCNTVIFTKYPNPNVQDIFWKVLKRTHPAYFWNFYHDKARREFLQRIFRALRSQHDHVYISSPDLRVLEAAKKLFI